MLLPECLLRATPRHARRFSRRSEALHPPTPAAVPFRSMLRSLAASARHPCQFSRLRTPQRLPMPAVQEPCSPALVVTPALDTAIYAVLCIATPLVLSSQGRRPPCPRAERLPCHLWEQPGPRGHLCPAPALHRLPCCTVAAPSSSQTPASFPLRLGASHGAMPGPSRPSAPGRAHHQPRAPRHATPRHVSREHPIPRRPRLPPLFPHRTAALVVCPPRRVGLFVPFVGRAAVDADRAVVLKPRR